MGADDGRVTRPERPGSRVGDDELLEPGAVVGQYVIEGLRARGGFAAVYRARHEVIDRPAALKVLSRDLAASDEMLRRFTREAQAVNRVRHANVVDIYDIGALTDGRPYLVMEWLDGGTLHDELARRGRMTPPDALAILEDLGAGLSAAHEVGVVHRDLKSANVILVPAGDWFLVKLVDFGIAKLLEPSPDSGTTASGVRLGTVETMAPEQILGTPVDRRADIYALGILLHELLTGALPFSGQTAVEIEQLHLRGKRPRPSELAPVSAAFDAIVERCLRVGPDQRYQSVDEFLRELRRAVSAGGEESGFRGTAVGLRVAAVEPVDDNDALDRADQCLDILRGHLADAGLSIALDTVNCLLAVAPLPAGEVALRRRLIALALELAPTAAAAGMGITVHVAPGEIDTTGEEVRVLGQIVELSDWYAGAGVVASATALVGLEGSVVAEPTAATGWFRIRSR